MIFKKFLTVSYILFSTSVFATGYDVFGLGIYDVLDAADRETAVDFRYERRFDNTLLEIGPESENFFNLKPFLGVETTSKSATYLLGGVYLEDNLGSLFLGEESNFNFTPSFGAGYYDRGSGKKLGHNIEFRTTLEVSYQLQSKNRIGLSLGHISNANLGDKNPGVEIISLTYQVPF